MVEISTKERPLFFVRITGNTSQFRTELTEDNNSGSGKTTANTKRAGIMIGGLDGPGLKI
jgi:hypothetical protein